MKRLEMSDAALIRSWRNSADVAKWMFSNHQVSEEEHLTWMRRVLSDDTCIYWLVILDGEPSGVASLVSISRSNERCYWTMYLASESLRGRGAGSAIEEFMIEAAFFNANVTKLCGEVLASNQRVLALHEKFGFKVEGVLRRHNKKATEWEDVIHIALFKEEWIALRESVRSRLDAKGIAKAEVVMPAEYSGLAQ